MIKAHSAVAISAFIAAALFEIPDLPRLSKPASQPSADPGQTIASATLALLEADSSDPEQFDQAYPRFLAGFAGLFCVPIERQRWALDVVANVRGVSLRAEPFPFRLNRNGALDS